MRGKREHEDDSMPSFERVFRSFIYQSPHDHIDDDDDNDDNNDETSQSTIDRNASENAKIVSSFAPNVMIAR